MRRSVSLIAMVLAVVACSRVDQASDRSDAEPDVFLRSTASGVQIWQRVDERAVRVTSTCGDAYAVGTEVNGRFVTLDANGSSTCGPGDELPDLASSFDFERSDSGLTVTVGPDVFQFLDGSEIPLDPDVDGRWFEVSQPGSWGVEQVALRVDGDRIEGVADCGSFETSITRDGSVLSTGHIRHQETCAGLEQLFDVLADRQLVVIGSAAGPSIWAGPYQGFDLEPADPPAAAEGELDATFVREPPPVVGEFHADEYRIGDEVRSTGSDDPFRLELSATGAVWFSDCNRSSASVLWSGTAAKLLDGSQTSALCPDALRDQSRNLSLGDGFDLVETETGWSLLAGRLTIDLVAGPPNALLEGIPVGSWTSDTVVLGLDGSFGLETGARLDVEPGGAAVVTTRCRSIRLDLSGVDAMLTELGPSTCSVADGLDAWIVSIVEHDRFTLARRSGGIGLWSPGAALFFSPNP